MTDYRQRILLRNAMTGRFVSTVAKRRRCAVYKLSIRTINWTYNKFFFTKPLACRTKTGNGNAGHIRREDAVPAHRRTTDIRNFSKSARAIAAAPDYSRAVKTGTFRRCVKANLSRLHCRDGDGMSARLRLPRPHAPLIIASGSGISRRGDNRPFHLPKVRPALPFNREL